MVHVGIAIKKDFSSINPAKLFARNFKYDKWIARWEDHKVFFKGGYDFKRKAGDYFYSNVTGASWGAFVDPSTEKRRRFLWQREGEPDVVYGMRWYRLSQNPYFRTIITTFESWAFSQNPTIKPEGDEQLSDEANTFLGDCDGTGKKLTDFLRDAFGKALLNKKCGWLIGVPSPNDLADNNVALSRYEAEDIRAWDYDDKGALNWVLLHKKQYSRPDLFSDTVCIEYYTYVSREDWAIWEVRGQTSGTVTGDQVALLDSGSHDLGEVPFVMFDLPSHMWIGNLIFDACLDLFNKENALAWTQYSSSFPQPVLTTKTGKADSKTFGESTLTNLKAADTNGGGQEKFEYVSPDMDPLRFTQEAIAAQRDEIFRTVHQMALALDNNSVGAIGRSGASKVEDRRATEIILNTYGALIREAIKRTMHLWSLIQDNNDVDWVVAGFDNFKIDRSLEEAAAVAQMMGNVDIPIPEFQAAWKVEFAQDILADIPEQDRVEVIEAIKKYYAGKTPADLEQSAPQGRDPAKSNTIIDNAHDGYGQSGQ